MKKILFFVFLMGSVFANAQTKHYISTTGNDGSGTGTIGNPWATLYKATNSVTTAGDTIIVNAGTYLETQQSLLGVGVNIKGVDSSTAIIRSTATAVFTPIILAASATVGTNGNQTIYNLKFDGQNTTALAVMFLARSNVSVNNCSLVNFQFAGVIFSGNPNLFSVPGNQQEPTIYATGNTFYNNRLMNCSGFQNWGGFGTYGSGQVWVTGQSGFLFHDNYMNQTQRTAGTNGWLIKGTDFTKGLKVYNNTMLKAPYPYTSSGAGDYWDFAMEMGDEQGLEIYNNTIQGCIDMNRQVKGVYAYSVYIHNNIIGYPTLGTGFENGIILEYGTETATIENNTFTNITEIFSFSTRSLSAVTDITIRKNLAYNIGQTGQGGNGSGIHFISDGSNNYIVRNFSVTNNTFAGNAGLTPFYGMSFSNAGSVRQLTIKNNILTNFGVNAVGANNGAVVDTADISYNDFFNTGAIIGWNSGTPSHYINSPNITGNPLFTNAGANDYTLQAGSPAKNTGSDGYDMGYTGGGLDVTPPTVTTTNPTNAATGVTSGSYNVIINFSENMNTATLNSTNITGITGTFTTGSNYVSIAATLAASTTYNITVNNAEDVAGNLISSPYNFSFTTGAAIPPPNGSGKQTILIRGAKIL